MLWVIFLTKLSGGMALTTVGFDCGAQPFDQLHAKTYSLLDVHSCSIKTPTIEVKNFTGQIVQTKLYEYREVFQCKIKVRRTIRRCSLFGYLEPVENAVQVFLLDLTRDQCKKIHDTNSFSYDSQHILSDLRVNQTTTRSIALAGNAIDNSCNVGSYSDRFGTWNKVNVEGLITITLTSYTAKVDVKNDNILLRSGVACTYSKTSCLDIENGYTFWDSMQDEDCFAHKLEVIYDGIIQAVTEIRDNVTSIHYFVNQNNILASLKFNGMHSVCRVPFIKTEFPSLYIIDQKEYFLRQRDVYPDLLTYINTKFVYVEGKTREQMGSLYIDILNKKCESDLAILRESLSLAYLAPDYFAYNLMGPGYMAYLSGELIHVVKCLPVEVEVQEELEKCYEQIPVTYNNKDMFLSYKTKILMKRSAETKCNKILKLGFKLGNEWYTFTPKLMRIDPPEMLSPDTQQTWTPEEIKNLATHGIYTEKDMEDYMAKIAFPLERKAIIDETIREITERQEKEKNFGYSNNPFSSGFWKALISGYWQDFKDFGNISSGIFMIFLILFVLTQAVNIVIRGLTIHKVFGFSTKLLAALFDSLTHFVLYIGQKQDKPKDEEVELNSIETSENTKKSRIPVRHNTNKYGSQLQKSLNEINELPYTIIKTPFLNRKAIDPKITKAVIHDESPKKPTEFDHISV